MLPATWSGFCFCTGRGRRGRGGPETGRGHQAGNECVVLSVVFPSLARLLLVRAGSTATASAAVLATLLQQLIQGWSTREIGEPSATSQGRRGEREEGKNFRLGESKWRRSVSWGGPPRRCSGERTPTPPRRPARARSLPTTQQSAGGRGSAGREQNVGQLEPSSISETGWQLKEGGRRRGRRRRTRSKEGRGKEGGSCVAVEEDSKRAKPTTTTR